MTCAVASCTQRVICDVLCWNSALPARDLP